MSSRFQKAGEFLRDAAQESARQVLSDHHDDGRIRGFSSAAGIALLRIQEKLDAYREQMKGPGLSKSEQASYAQLDELKSLRLRQNMTATGEAAASTGDL